MTESPELRAVLDRDFTVPVPEVRQCHRHASTPLVERSIDCAMCVYDLRAALQHALLVNEWLDKWRQDVLSVRGSA